MSSSQFGEEPTVDNNNNINGLPNTSGADTGPPSNTAPDPVDNASIIRQAIVAYLDRIISAVSSNASLSASETDMSVSSDTTTNSAGASTSTSSVVGTKRTIWKISSSSPSDGDDDEEEGPEAKQRCTLRLVASGRQFPAQAVPPPPSPAQDDDEGPALPASVEADDMYDASGSDLDDVEADLDDLETMEPEDTFVLLEGISSAFTDDEITGLQGDTMDGLDLLYNVFAREEESDVDEDEA
ncbi:hypothetical protein F4779DRAFT_455663 [Xylariaceae sp. FL0662B]|nr:hypothetical protein F4779DRAFT_455663 [Xylariaceae sp. FL0662B]